MPTVDLFIKMQDIEFINKGILYASVEKLSSVKL